ncbi:MAG: hypothetical protein U0324_32130 [Polyangiales bacterium]
MAIGWTGVQRVTVDGVLARFPPDSGRCADAARAIVPIARDVDPTARGRLIQPDPVLAPRARFVVPKRCRLSASWFHHVTVEAAGHCVDVLTGPDGCEVASYLDAHFEYADVLRVDEVDLSREDL